MGRFISPGRAAREKRAAEEALASRRRFLRLGLLALGGLGALTALTPLAFRGVRTLQRNREITKLLGGTITFDQARQYHELRQPFLDQILGTNQIPYCSGAIYDHDGGKLITWSERSSAQRGGINKTIGGELETFRGGMYDIKTPEILNDAGSKGKVPIFVGRLPFSADTSFSLFTAEDLAHCIRYHEGRHCVQHGEGLPFVAPALFLDGVKKGLIRPSIAYHLGELDALGAEISATQTNQGLGAFYPLESKAKYMDTHRGLSLVLAHGPSSLEQQIILDAFRLMSTNPSLQDISVPSSYYEQKKRFK
jgi:hypothetical protein